MKLFKNYSVRTKLIIAALIAAGIMSVLCAVFGMIAPPTATWPTATAKLDEVRVKSVGNRFAVNTRWKYEVDGTTHFIDYTPDVGGYGLVFDQHFIAEERAKDFRDSMTESLFYNPANPAEATVNPYGYSRTWGLERHAIDFLFLAMLISIVAKFSIRADQFRQRLLEAA